jgi:phosphatidate phosphatase APP1
MKGKKVFRVNSREGQQRKNRRSALIFLRRLGERRILMGRGKEGMTPEEYATKVAKLPDRVAAIIGKTGAEMGDSATLADDEALMRIRDLLFEIDDSLLERNKNKRLSRR